MVGASLCRLGNIDFRWALAEEVKDFWLAAKKSLDQVLVLAHLLELNDKLFCKWDDPALDECDRCLFLKCGERLHNTGYELSGAKDLFCSAVWLV